MTISSDYIRIKTADGKEHVFESEYKGDKEQLVLVEVRGPNLDILYYDKLSKEYKTLLLPKSGAMVHASGYRPEYIDEYSELLKPLFEDCEEPPEETV